MNTPGTAKVVDSDITCFFFKWEVLRFKKTVGFFVEVFFLCCAQYTLNFLLMFWFCSLLFDFFLLVFIFLNFFWGFLFLPFCRNNKFRLSGFLFRLSIRK